jgi:hypothetical protein
MRKTFFLIICFILLVSSCDSPGGGAVFFETVMITAHSEITSIDADIITWKLGDPNGDSDDQCDPNYSEVWPESVEVIIRSEVFPVNDLETSSPVRIENVHIDYIPADGLTPGLASRNEPLGQIVQPDNNVSLNIKVMGTNQKNGFLDDPNDYASLITNNSYYTYYVNLTFSVVEIVTDKKDEVSTGLTIQVHDFKCVGDDCDDECVHP